uniref:RB1-inducible coiled-coil protein 1 n=1 Tax=Pavo cristatus TaxID=9049 RepID=A0A8C9FG98_PAVCR
MLPASYIKIPDAYVGYLLGTLKLVNTFTQCVADLKHAIQAKYKIAIQHQVLVVNGGECMAPDRRVCSYSAGTDTNPIFLFNKEMILCERPPAIPKTTFSAENEMELKVEESLMMPAVFHTVASRTQLAVEMYEVAKKLCSFCEGLVHDEHLQHQGWAAIMANLEDCTYSYQKLLFKFENVYSSYLQSIEDIKLKLTHLGSAVSVMAKIPLLECLTRHSYRECLGRLDSSAEHGGAESEEAENGKSSELVLYSDVSKVNNKSMLASFCKSVEHSALEGTNPENVKDDKESGQNTAVQDNETSVELKDDDQPSFNVSLLDWINVQDRPNDVESLVRKCFDSMSRWQYVYWKLQACFSRRPHCLDNLLIRGHALKVVCFWFFLKPRRFDSELPDISLSDLQFLQSFCPSEVQPLLSDSFEHFFVLEQIGLLKLFSLCCCYHLMKDIRSLLCVALASNSQTSPQSATTPRMESTTGTTIATSSRTPPSLSLQGPLCPPVCPPAPLEELSPDSIDAHTFDFETIAHPNLEQALKQGSLDLDSLAESPESDFMSAVNEFVIEENPASPNVISDPQSPEMMVESLYSSVINAIDSRRMQDTSSCVKDVSVENASRSVCVEKCKLIAQDSKVHLRGIKEDLCHFRTLVQKEQCDFSNSLKCTSLEIVNTIEKVKLSLEKTLKDKHQKELQSLKSEYETKINKLLEDDEESKKKIVKLKGDLLGLEEVLQNKNDEFAMVKNEKEAVVSLQNEKDQKLHELECQMETQNTEIKKLRQSREIVLEDLKKLHVENDEKLQLLRAELQNLEQSHLKELENNLQARHLQEFEKVLAEHKDSLDKLKKENQHRLEQMEESHAAVVQEKQQQVEELKLKVSDLSDLRCKLEVELALKEAETDEMKLLLEESRNQQQETLKSQIDKETESLKKEIEKLNSKIQVSSDEYQVGLSELRTLMTIEKDQCISELVDRYEEESNLLRTELNKVTVLHQKTSEAEKRLSDQIAELQCKLELEKNALEKEKTEKMALCEQQEKYEAIIHRLKEEKDLLVSNQEQDKQLLIQKLNSEKEDAVQTACKEFELQKEAAEKGLLEKIQQLEIPPTESSAESSLVAELQEKLQEEKLKFLEQLEEQERRKNEEMQNIRTSLTAEQQVKEQDITGILLLLQEFLFTCVTDLIETLSEDRARLLEEKKKLEEEVSKLRSSNLSPSTYLTAASEACGACAADVPADTERLASDIAPEGRMDSTMETSMMAVIHRSAILPQCCVLRSRYLNITLQAILQS